MKLLRALLHPMLHKFLDCWETTENLPVPGYTRLVRQRCTVCGETRVTELAPLPSATGRKS